MGRDTSLTDFLDDTSSEEKTGESGNRSPNAANSRSREVSDTDEPDNIDAIEPASRTYHFDPSGCTCATCGAQVERRWRQDTELVCQDCKTW